MAFPISSRARLGRLFTVSLTLTVAGMVFPALCLGAQVAAGGNNTIARQPVLVELFTSEGCSDCPPADALLALLDATQFVPGAQAIVLSEHITYFNHLGWRDPFSLDAVTGWQHQYASNFALNDVYTPQAVVDGAAQFVGNEQEALTRAVAHAAQIQKSLLTIQDAHWAQKSVTFSVRAPKGSESKRSANLMAALAEDSAQSAVTHGENKGRTLSHVAVVRVLKNFGPSAIDGRPLSLKYPGEAQPGHAETTKPLRLVVFLADRRTGHVLSVAEQTITR